ncbi:MAG: ATP-dependent helicase [Fibrobacteria bacterium]|nr:ATP-dependent helicase [Fibrobacteria bacterium]
MTDNHAQKLTEFCNSSQKKAVLYDHAKNGPLFLLAGAGSGKTFVLTTRIVYLILNGISPSSLVALTFTEAAAKEMSERAINKLNDFGYSSPLQPRASTFHSLSLNIITTEVTGKANWERLGFTQKPSVISEEQKVKFIQDISKRLTLNQSFQELTEWMDSPFYTARKSGEVQQNQDTDSFSNHSGIKKAAQTMYRDYLLEHNLLTFGDMVYLATTLLQEYSDVRNYYQNKFQYLLVDEYQDTSPDQLTLIKLLSAPQNNLFLVGDDDQAIYGFRGADSQCIEKLFKEFPGISVIKMELNYRSTASVLNYANTIFRNKPKELQKRLLPGKISDNNLFTKNLPVITRIHPTSLAEGIWIAEEIRRLMSEELLNWSDFTILYRLNRQAAYYRNLIKGQCGDEAAKEVGYQTIHSSKGLQYPVVFLVGLETGTFPHKHMGKELTQEKYEEEKRLFYVGVTRAENLLYISACRSRMVRGKMRKQKASPFILKAGSFFTRVKNQVLTGLVP